MTGTRFELAPPKRLVKIDTISISVDIVSLNRTNILRNHTANICRRNSPKPDRLSDELKSLEQLLIFPPLTVWSLPVT